MTYDSEWWNAMRELIQSFLILYLMLQLALQRRRRK